MPNVPRPRPVFVALAALLMLPAMPFVAGCGGGATTQTKTATDSRATGSMELSIAWP